MNWRREDRLPKYYLKTHHMERSLAEHKERANEESLHHTHTT